MRIYKQDILTELYDLILPKGLIKLGDSSFFIANGKIKMRNEEKGRTWIVSNFSLSHLKEILDRVKEQINPKTKP